MRPTAPRQVGVEMAHCGNHTCASAVQLTARSIWGHHTYLRDAKANNRRTDRQ